MNDSITCFITWTTYGTWLPGDSRGWRKTNKGNQPPQPLLEAWCRNRMSESARSNHVHLAVTADKAPELVRDQFKANATRVLRQEPDAITNDKVWTRGGDCEIVDGEDNLERVVRYITEAQDRMDRGK